MRNLKEKGKFVIIFSYKNTLGCRKLYPESQSSISLYLQPYCNFYNLNEKDPEDMLKPNDFDGSISAYHFRYLHELTNRLARETRPTKYKYRKSNPGFALERECLNGMAERIDSTSDLNSFREFYDFILSEREYNSTRYEAHASLLPERVSGV